ncbi:Kir-like protein [Plasmodium coatneyi]|uniref:Kir-like protein n=1 Tax=Plasmodium coatneyi TaxID=208452 RepID=A0A1B1DWH1_9APIC|nr:Kir-like protein [Plasmodium coatneyi]ANQ06947.1 Kir-like protein [Plasmodium coatneyi]
MKNFMDYIEDYKFIKGEIGKSTYYACQTYLDYLKERIPLYLSFEPLCTKLGLNACTNYIQGYFLYDPRKLFTKYELLKLYVESWWNPCYKNAVDVFNDFQKSPTAFIAKYNKYVQPFIDNPERKKVILAQRGEVRHSNAEANPQPAAISLAANSEKLTEIPSKVHSDDNIFLRFINEKGFSLSKVALCTFFSVLTITMLIAALMKFTPLGNRFSRRRKRIRSELEHNIYPADGDPIFDSYDSLTTISDGSEHSIAYDAM